MLLTLLTTAFAAALPPGTPVERALAIHLSNTGLTHLGDAIEGLVPPTFPVANIGGELACDDADLDPLTYNLDAIDLRLRAEDVALVARDGQLNLTLYLSLSSSPSELVVQGDCSFLTGLDEVCGVELPTTSIVANFTIGLSLVDDGQGGQVIQADASDPTIELTPIGNPLSDCTLANAIGTLLGQDGSAISNILLGFIQPELVGLGDELEGSIEDALNGLVIETSLSLGEGELALSLYPSALNLDDTGLFLGLAATSRPSVVSRCVDAGNGSEFADAPWPELTGRAFDTSLEYDAAIYLNKDFVDHVLWGVYASGALCLNVSEQVQGLTLDSSFFGNFFGDSFSDLFDPEHPSPVNIVTAPLAAPTIGWAEDGAPMRLQLNGLGLNFEVPLDDRLTRIFQVAIVGDIGIDPGLTATQLAPSIDINPDALDFQESYSEIVQPGFARGLADFLPTVLGTVLPDDLLPTIAIPTILGIGLETVFWVPDADGQWMGGFVLLDTADVQPLEVAGCEGGSLGCDGFEGGADPFDFNALLGCDQLSAGCGGDSGCADTGCATQRRVVWPGTRIVLFAFALALAARRRRA